MEPTPTTPEHPAPILDPAAPAPSHSPSTGLRLAIGGAIAVLAAGLAFVVLGQGAGTDGGADSPEAAIEALIEAVEASDFEAALATVAPGERSVLDDGVREVLSELGRIGVLANNIDLAAVPGVDLEVIDLSLTTTSASDDVAMVAIGGTLRATFFGLDLPFGPALTDSDLLPIAVADLPSPPPTALDLTLATVRIDGRWFVSFGHTLAELWRTDNGWPSPDPAAAMPARGFDSPDALVEAFVAALEPLDPAALIAMLNPGEASAAHRQAPNYLRYAESWANTSANFTIDDLQYRIEVDGDRADVVVDVLALTTVYEDTWNGATYTTKVRFEDGCINVLDSTTAAPDGYEQEQYMLPNMTHEDDGSYTMCPTDDRMGLGFLAGGLLGSTSSPPTVGLVRHDGQWYVSPVLTLVNQLLDSTLSIPDGGAAEAIQGFLTPFDSLTMESGDSWGEVEPYPTESTATTIEMTFETTMNAQEG